MFVIRGTNHLLAVALHWMDRCDSVIDHLILLLVRKQVSTFHKMLLWIIPPSTATGFKRHISFAQKFVKAKLWVTWSVSEKLFVLSCSQWSANELASIIKVFTEQKLNWAKLSRMCKDNTTKTELINNWRKNDGGWKLKRTEPPKWRNTKEGEKKLSWEKKVEIS